MKNLVLMVLFLGVVFPGHAQILLKETRVDYVLEKLKVDPVTNSLEVEVAEKFVGEFQEDPLLFLKKNFDAVKLAEDNAEEKFDRFEVTFKSKKGLLLASFDREGNLISTFQKFKGVSLPKQLKTDLYTTYGKAEILKTKYIATSRAWEVDREFYRLKIRAADGTKRLKMFRKEGQSRFASM